MAARAELAEVGWAIQASEGSPATNPTYLLASLWGGLPEPTQSTDAIKAGASFGTVQEVRKYAEYWQADLELPAFTLSTGTLLKAMLPTEGVTGTGPYAHAFTPAATKRWLTLFSRRPGGMYERFDDGRVEGVSFAFTSGEPVVLEATLMGKTPQRLASAYTPATIERMDRTTPWLHYAGSTMLWDEDDDTPTGDISPLVESGRVRIQRGLSAVPLADTGGLLGFRQMPYEVMLEMEMVWANYDAYRASYYGGAGGNTPSPTVVYGSIDFLMKEPVDAGPPGNMSGWYDASSITGLVDTDPVATWPDLSGLGNHVSQGTGVKQPTYRTNVLNGRPTVRFDGTNDDLRKANAATMPTGAGPLTVVAVASRGAATTQRILAGRAVSSVRGWGYQHANGASATGDRFTTPAVKDYDIANGWPAAHPTFYVKTVILDAGADVTTWRDGVLVGTATHTVFGNAAISTDGFVLGANEAGGSNFWDGDIAEVLVYNRELTAAERQQAETYLSLKWGIPLASGPHSLRLQVPRMAFHVTPPEPGLGVAVLSLSGEAAWPSSGQLVTATLTNGLATNYG